MITKETYCDSCKRSGAELRKIGILIYKIEKYDFCAQCSAFKAEFENEVITKTQRKYDWLSSNQLFFLTMIENTKEEKLLEIWGEYGVKCVREYKAKLSNL